MLKPTKIIILDQKVAKESMDFPHSKEKIWINTREKIQDLIFRRHTKWWREISLWFYNAKRFQNSFLCAIEDEQWKIIIELTRENLKDKDEIADFFNFLTLYTRQDSIDWIEDTIDCKGFYELLSWLVGGKLAIDSKRKSTTFWWEIDTNAFDVTPINEEKISQFTFWDILLLTHDIDEESKHRIKSDDFDMTQLSYTKPHFAFYIWNGYFISKYWGRKKFAISIYSDLLSTYSGNYLFRLTKKEKF